MKKRLPLILNALLWLTVLGLAAALSLKHDRQWDWTAGQRNTLTKSSRELLQQLSDPVLATAYVFPGADLEREIRARFAPYLREKPDFSLRFVDPTTDPQAVRTLGISASGEILLQYQGRQETLRDLSEPQISAALQRLSYAETALIVFSSGHGERNPQDDAPAGYAQLVEILRSKGLQTQRLSLATQVLPPQTRLLVLASPQQALLDGEKQQVLDYLNTGGSLLWLHDPQTPRWPELASTLGIEQLPGHVIYQDYELLGSSHPAMALVADYPEHPITRNLDSLTLLPLAGALRTNATSPWQARPLLRSAKRSWLETGPLEGSLTFDQDSELLGPLTLGLGLTRTTAQGETQRAAVIADSDFASNGYIAQLGNRAFSGSLFQWLLARDAQIHIDLPPAPDRQLQLSPLATRLIAALFVLVLPGLLITTGFWRWRQRGRQR